MEKRTIKLSRYAYDRLVVGNERLLPLYYAAARKWDLFGVRLFFKTATDERLFLDILAATSGKQEYTVYR